MDIEYHYYITYLIAKKAGYGNQEARTIGHASQYVDDNTQAVVVDKSGSRRYESHISQTSNILKPNLKLLRIYSHFHFVPGNPRTKSAQRRDGKLHLLNTTPDNANARRILQKALATNDLYQIGIASHAFSDTWAHQNFVGYKDGFNAMDTPLGNFIPNIGHADAKHDPDVPGRIWQDDRLLYPKYRIVNNTQRFLLAAGRLFEELRRHIDPTCSDQKLREDRAGLRMDLKAAMSAHDDRKSRIEEYKKLGWNYGLGEIEKYKKALWYDEAIKEETRTTGRRRNTSVKWKSPNYKRTNWYCFQEAVKSYKEMVGTVLTPLFMRLDLEFMD